MYFFSKSDAIARDTVLREKPVLMARELYVVSGSFTNLSDFVDFSEVKGYNHLTTEEEMQKLIDIAQKSLSYYSFLDITSPELTDFGYKTVRFVAPELLAMHFPGCPYLNHPYFKNKGVCVKDVFPHPLP